MCQSKANGGHRCTGNPTRTSRRNLQRQAARARDAGHTTRADALTAQITRLDQARSHYGDVVTPLVIDLPPEVDQALDVIRTAGYRPLIVGGSVRDALSDGRAPKDIDVEVYGATIDEVAAALRTQYRVDEVGKAFGVLKATLPDGTDLDVSVPRRDNQVGAGHRGFEVEMDRSMTVTEAASRRDFTLNSMGYDPEYGACVDPYNGRTDLANRVLRHTSAAFAEDPLRVLRGYQFAARYGMTLDPDTAALCRDLVPRAAELPVERVRGEWGKFYTKGTAASRGLEVLAESGWDATVPGLPAVNTPTVRARADQAHQVAAADSLTGDARTRLVAATLAQGMSDADARAFLDHTVEGVDLQNAAYGLSRATPPETTDDTAVRTWARTLGSGKTSVREWSRLARVTGNHTQAVTLLQAAERLGCADAPQPDLLQGRDVLPRFPDRKPGPWTGQVLRDARHAQDTGVFTTPDAAAQWLADYQITAS